MISINLKLNKLDHYLNNVIIEEKIPGAVILIGKGQERLFHQAYGYSQIFPSKTLMAKDTLFDIASLIKVVSIWPSIIKLIQEKEVYLKQKIIDFFGTQVHPTLKNVTIYDLLTHTSGLSERTFLKRSLPFYFRRPNQESEVIPVDWLLRILLGEEWSLIEKGITQRSLVINLMLNNRYSLHKKLYESIKKEKVIAVNTSASLIPMDKGAAPIVLRCGFGKNRRADYYDEFLTWIKVEKLNFFLENEGNYEVEGE